MSIFNDTLIGLDEDLRVTEKHDVYPYIDPTPAFSSQSYAGKVILVTGASSGIGAETATFFAKAGASVVLVARKQITLDKSKASILSAKPDAQVLTFPADVTDAGKAKEAIAATVQKFGRLDVVVANAGVYRNSEGQGFAGGDADGWWKTVEINFRGVYNYLHYSVPELKKTKGTFIATSSRIALLRLRTASDYAISKFAVNRLIEFAVIENPEIKAFAAHPGVVDTELNRQAEGSIPAVDSVELSAAVYLHLADGKADYFSGRYVSANWDLEEVEKKYKDKIVAGNGLVEKLALPA